MCKMKDLERMVLFSSVVSGFEGGNGLDMSETKGRAFYLSCCEEGEIDLLTFAWFGKGEIW